MELFRVELFRVECGEWRVELFRVELLKYSKKIQQIRNYLLNDFLQYRSRTYRKGKYNFTLHTPLFYLAYSTARLSRMIFTFI